MHGLAKLVSAQGFVGVAADLRATRPHAERRDERADMAGSPPYPATWDAARLMAHLAKCAINLHERDERKALVASPPGAGSDGVEQQ